MKAIKFPSAQAVPFFERGWERAIETRKTVWKTLDFRLRSKLIDRWALAMVNRIAKEP